MEPGRPRVRLRDVTLADAAPLARIVARNRADFEATEPPRGDAFYTEAGQVARISRILDAVVAGEVRFFVILIGDAIAGEMALEAIDRRWQLSARVGYLVDRDHRGRGVAAEALRQLIDLAFCEMGLHRLEAGTLVSNLASQRVVEKTGFRRIGLVERYLFVGGCWQDNYLYELVGPDVTPASSA